MSYRTFPMEGSTQSVSTALAADNNTIADTCGSEEPLQAPKSICVPTLLCERPVVYEKQQPSFSPSRRVTAVSTIDSIGCETTPDAPTIGPPCAAQGQQHSPCFGSPPPPLYKCSDMPSALPSAEKLAEIKETMRSERVQVCQDALPLFESDKEWQHVTTKQNVTIFKLNDKEGKELPMIKGRMNFGKDMSPWDVIDFVRDWDAKRLWDDSYSNGSCLVEFDYYTAIVWLMFKGMMMYEPRDFIQVCYTHVLAEGKVLQVVKGTSILPEPTLPRKRSVRGDLLVGGFLCETLADGSLEVTFLAQVDLKVKAPNAVVARMPFFVDQPLCLAKIHKTMTAMKKSGKFVARDNRPVDFKAEGKGMLY